MRRGAVVAVLVSWGVVLAAAADAAPLPSNCAQSGQTVECTFSYTGAEQSLPIPGDVTSVHVDAVGASGGRNGGPFGAPGGIESANVAVTPGSTLYVEVGGDGHDGGNQLPVPGNGHGGWNGGGDGGSGSLATGAGGGGASDVRTISCGGACPGLPFSLNSRRLVAAGGGGAGTVGPGHAEGLGGTGDHDGTAGGGDASVGGGGAGLAPVGEAGGLPGSGGTGATAGDSGVAGGLGQGGAGGVNAGGGGGGGAGVYGGGGGGGSAFQSMPFDQSGSGGGGGGSSFAPGGMTSVADPGTAAVVKISYTPFVAQIPQPVPTPPQLPTVTITKPANVAKYVKGQRVVVAYTCSAVLGNTIKSCVGTVPNGGTLPTSKPGLATFKVTATTTAGLSASQTVTYRVIVPTKKKGIATTVTLDYAKKLTLTGTLVGSLGTPKLELPFKPCKTATFTSCTSSSGSSFTLRARLSNRKLATVTALVKSKQSANRGTVKTTVKSSGTTVTLNYTMDSPRVAKLDTPKHGSGQLIKIRYSKLAPGACKPAGSC